MTMRYLCPLELSGMYTVSIDMLSKMPYVDDVKCGVYFSNWCCFTFWQIGHDLTNLRTSALLYDHPAKVDAKVGSFFRSCSSSSRVRSTPPCPT